MFLKLKIFIYRCILAALTMDHRLCLYEEMHKEWVSICDLTEVLKAGNEDIKEVSHLAEKMKKQSSRKKNIKIRDSKNRTRNKQKVETESQSEDEELSFSTSDIFNYDTMKERTYKLAPVGKYLK